MRMPLRVALAAAVLLFTVFAALAQVALPTVTSRVTDTTGTLTAQQRAALEERLRAFEAKKGSQIVVVVVPTTAPETIEQYAIRLAEQVKPGRKKVDDGVILVVALKDRALRIEVGYGLEGVVPDAVAKRIVSDDIVPHFKRNDFFGGIDAGVTRLIALIEGEKLPPGRRSEMPASGGDGGGGLESFLMIGFVLVFIVGGLLRAMLGRFVGSGMIGGLAGVAGWFLLGSLAIGIGVAVVAMLLSLMGGFAGRHGRGGWYSGGWPGGGIGGGWGGGGGGSWGGGGGGFGGGGASGRW